MEMKNFLIFKRENLYFCFLSSIADEIYKLKSWDEIADYTENPVMVNELIFSETLPSKEFIYLIYSKQLDLYFFIPYELKKISVIDSEINFNSEINPFISGYFNYNNFPFFILSFAMLKQYFQSGKPYKNMISLNDLEALFLNSGENKNINSGQTSEGERENIVSSDDQKVLQGDDIEGDLISHGKKPGEPDQIKKVTDATEKKADGGKREESDKYLGTEEEKKAIFEEIEGIMDSLKIKDIKSKRESYLKVHFSFSKVILVLYLILFGITAAGFSTIYYFNKVQEQKKATDIKSIGGMEAIILKELQRKQEEEKKQLESQLNAVQDELSKLSVERDNFLKNQDEILAQKEEVIYSEYQKKLEEQKKLLESNSISKEEYDKIVSQIQNDYQDQKVEAQKEIEKAKQDFLTQMKEKEDELLKQQQQFQNDLSKKQEEIQKAVAENAALSSQLAEQQQKNQELQQQLDKLKNTSVQQLLVQGKLDEYLYTISLNLNQQKYSDALKEIENFQHFLLYDDEAKLMEQERRDYYLDLLTVLNEQVSKIISDIKSYNEKMELLKKGDELFKKGSYPQAYDLYKQAFTQYSVLTSLDQNSLANFEKITYMINDSQQKSKLEGESLSLYNKIIQQVKSGDYKAALDSINLFISKYPSSSKLVSVINYKLTAETAFQLEENNKQAYKMLLEAKNYFENNDYNKAKTRCLDILIKYPDNSYIRDIVELIKKIDEQILNSVAQTNQTIVTAENLIEAQEFEIIGRIIFYSEDSDIVKFRLEKINAVKVGDELKIYKLDNNNYVYIAKIKVLEIADDVVKATILFKKEPVIFGSVVSF